MNRREFLKGALAALAAAVLPRGKPVETETPTERWPVAWDDDGNVELWSDEESTLGDPPVPELQAGPIDLNEWWASLGVGWGPDLQGDIITPGAIRCGIDAASPDDDYAAITLGCTDGDGVWHTVTTVDVPGFDPYEVIVNTSYIDAPMTSASWIFPPTTQECLDRLKMRIERGPHA